MRETYGVVLPGMKLEDLTGKLIVIEGTDGVGRTTQIKMLKPWLEQQGRAVLETGVSRSSLAGSRSGTPRSSAVKSGRRTAFRRISTSASFDTPTNGEASTVARATSS